MKQYAVANYKGNNFELFQDGGEILMPFEQLGTMLGYKESRYLRDLVEANPELNNEEFSILRKNKDGSKIRERRYFTEDGVYEVCLISKQPFAKEFRKFVRELLKKVRAGELENIRPISLVKWHEKADKLINEMMNRNADLDEMAKNLDQIIELVPKMNEKFREIDEMRKDISSLKTEVQLLNLKLDDLTTFLKEGADIEDA